MDESNNFETLQPRQRCKTLLNRYHLACNKSFYLNWGPRLLKLKLLFGDKMDVTKREMMETLVEKFGDAALPLIKLTAKELYAFEQAANSFELRVRCDAQYAEHARTILGIRFHE